MPSPSMLQHVPITDIELDKTNPRIRQFIEHYGENPTAHQIFMALNAGDDTDEESNATGVTFAKLKKSILATKGIIQPIILRRKEDGRFVCVEGNTRVALYLSFIEDGVEGNWDTIPAIVHDQINLEEIEAIRLQAHLVGPRAWDPYSKARHLHYLRNSKQFTFCQQRRESA